MRTRIALALVIFGLATLVRPSSAEACSCIGTFPSSIAMKSADLVFIGTVIRYEGPKPSGEQPPVTTFAIGHVFKGRTERQVVLVGEVGSCNHPFTVGETWLVYALDRDGRMTTNTCTRTRLRVDAGQDLVYLEGVEQRRQQGIVFGYVFRKVVGADGQPAQRALFEPLQVIAVGGGRRVEVTTDKWGPYQLVLPPGDFEIWVERAGRTVAPRQKIHIEHGKDMQLHLTADYKD